MSDYGVTDQGFVIKPFDTILNDSQLLAQQMFGADVDLTSTSPLRKILEATAMEDAELWKSMEDLYYSNFVSTASGDNLDLLGDDLGIGRQFLFSAGSVQFKITTPAAGRNYVLPEGTVVVTGTTPVVAFYTTAALTLNATTPQANVPVLAFERGASGDVAAAAIVGVDPMFAQVNLNLGAATLTVTNPAVFSGGAVLETDDSYRLRMLGLARNMWTLDSVRQAALSVNGVLDVLLSDPLGGVDSSQSYFNLFDFNERAFSSERSLGQPYFFDIVVAHQAGRPWQTLGASPGIYDQVQAAVDLVRPIGIHPNIIEADHIEVGVQATVSVDSGSDPQAILAAVKQSLASDLGSLTLGGAVLYSHVMAAFVEQTGVLDVQNLHLRRAPADFGGITFGAVPFQLNVIEAAPGENLIMGPTEIALFQIDSDLNDLETTSA